MISYHFDQQVIWHVIFHPGGKLFGKYSHVSLAGFSNNTWIHLDLHRLGFSAASLFAHDEVEGYLAYLLEHYTVVRFGPCRGRSLSFLAPMSCVAFAKHVLGVRSSALRPDAFLKFLLREYDAEILNDAENRGNS